MSLDVYLQVGKSARVVYTANITHNLGKMADEAGVYEHLWRPDELKITKAAQLIEPLKKGLIALRDAPAYFKNYNSTNDWGRYEDLVLFIEKYLEACEDVPEADVEVSR